MKTTSLNPLLAYYNGTLDLFGRRETVILATVSRAPHWTDREVATVLGYQDPNKTRPRITELIDGGVLMKTGDRLDHVTGRRVRTISLRPDPRKS